MNEERSKAKKRKKWMTTRRWKTFILIPSGDWYHKTYGRAVGDETADQESAG
jgi:hypothetical protein